MRSITIEWRDSETGPIRYLVNGSTIGGDDDGFDAVLEAVRDNPDAQVTVKGAGGGLGGEDLPATTPFADRFAELLEALGERRLTWSLL